MRLSPLNLSISSVARLKAVPAAILSPPLITPENFDFVNYGDSRGEDGLNGSLTANGYAATSSNYGPAGWFAALSGHRLRPGRFPNFAISASNTSQGAAVPRLSALGQEVNSTPKTWWRGSDSVNKGADYVAAHPAGIVTMLFGVNDADASLPTTSRANILNTINNFRPIQLKVIYNETATGLACDGTSISTVTQNKKDFAAWIKTLSYDSGHPNARPDVIVVDSFAATFDPNTNQNILGLLRDDRHFTPWGARFMAQLLIDRLAAALGAIWTNLPRRVTWPTVGQNGYATPANAAPFVNVNPGMNLGTNGQVVGANFGVAPSAADIIQGFAVSGSGTFAGITVVGNKTELDPDGYPVQKFVITGTLPDASQYTLDFYSIIEASGVTFNMAGKYKGVGMYKVDLGSNCLSGVNLNARINSTTAALSHRANEGVGSQGASGARRGFALNSNGFDAAGIWLPMQTQLLDLADPNLEAANGGPGVFANKQAAGIYASAIWYNYTGATQTIDCVLRYSRMGLIQQNAS